MRRQPAAKKPAPVRRAPRVPTEPDELAFTREEILRARAA